MYEEVGKIYLTTQVSIQNKIHAHMLESQSGRRRAASKCCSGHHSGQLSLPRLACLRYARERAEQMASRMAILAWCASKVGCQSMNENSSQGEMIRKTYTVTQQCLALCRFRFMRSESCTGGRLCSSPSAHSYMDTQAFKSFQYLKKTLNKHSNMCFLCQQLLDHCAYLLLQVMRVIEGPNPSETILTRINTLNQ